MIVNNERLSGRVLDPEGQPAAGILLQPDGSRSQRPVNKSI